MIDIVGSPAVGGGERAGCVQGRAGARGRGRGRGRHCGQGCPRDRDAAPLAGGRPLHPEAAHARHRGLHADKEVTVCSVTESEQWMCQRNVAVVYTIFAFSLLNEFHPNQLEKLEAAKSAYHWIPFLHFPYLFLPFLTISCIC